MIKFAVVTRDPKNEEGIASYIFRTSDTPTLPEAIRMLQDDPSWQKKHIQALVPFPTAAKQMGPVQALAAMLGEIAQGREARMVVFSNRLPILPHKPYHVSGSTWFTYDHAGNEIVCPDPSKVVPLQPAPGRN